MREIKMVVFDLDGTVIGHNQKISKETYEVLDNLKRRGIITATCSGRTFPMVCDQLKQSVTSDYCIFCNGGYIAHKFTGEILAEFPLSKEKMTEVFKAVPELDGHHKMSYFDHLSDDVDPDNFTGVSIPVFVDDIYEEIDTTPYHIYKGQFFFESNLAEKKRVEEKLKCIEGIAVTSAFPFNVEVNNIEATKGNGVKILAEKYGIDLENVMCVGDSTNDISMFEIAGFAVGMGNGASEIANHVDYMTDSIENNGFAKAIQKLILQEG